MARSTRLKPQPMDEHRLKQIIRSEVVDAQGFLGGELSEQRRAALELYYGEPLGNEIEGRSQVVMSDTMDTVEWIMPALMRVFFAGNDIVKFDPVGAEDEELSEQKTDYCNHVFLKDNNGFEITYDWFKDALLQKTGILKCVWDDTPEKTRSTHTRLNVLDLAELLDAEDGEEIEVIEQREYEIDEDDEDYDDDSPDVMPIGGDMPQQLPPALAGGNVMPMPPQGMAPMMGQPPEMGGDMMADSRKRFDVVILRTQTRGRIKIECIPPEEFLKSRRAVDPDSSSFTGHRYQITVSEAREMGFKDEDIEGAVGSSSAGEFNEERITRFDIDDEMPEGQAEIDPAARKLWIIEGYYRIDYDGDGFTELRQIITAGENNSIILSNEVVDDHPWINISPIRIPHKWDGLGMADLVADLQRIRSTIVRQLLDHMYNVNSGRAFISQNVNLDDWLANRPNQGVRVNLKSPGETVAQHAQPVVSTPIGPFAYPLLEFMDSEKIARTGINKYQQGLDADALNKTATGSARIMAAANARIELIARLFAEQGFVRLFRRIARLTTQNQDKTRTIRLRNTWVDVDPKSWSEGMDMTSQVGLGYDSKEQEGALVGGLLTLMEKAMNYQGGLNGPMVFPEHLHNAFEKFVKSAGFRNVDQYFEDPRSDRGKKAWAALAKQPPKPDPEMLKLQGQQQLEQAKLQMDGERAQMETEADMQKAQVEAAQNNQKMQGELALAREKAAAEIQVAREKAEAEIRLETMKAQADINIEREKLGLEREKLVVNAQIQQTELETRAAIERDKMQTDAAIRDRDSERTARAAAASRPEPAPAAPQQPPVNVIVEGSKQGGIRIKKDGDTWVSEPTEAAE